MSRVFVLNTMVDSCSFDEALEAMDDLIAQQEMAYVVTPNVDHVVRLEADARFREAYEHANLVLADGMPLLWAARLHGTPLKDKVSGSDILPSLCMLCARKGYRLFLLGAKEEVAQRAASRLVERYEGLKVVGAYSPPMGFDLDAEQVDIAISKVREAKPDVLVVALGSPKQELFIYENLAALNVPLSLGLGAALDFTAGNVKRAPAWMQRMGLEWLFRLLKEPKRLTGRYMRDAARVVPIAMRYLAGRHR